MSAGARFAATGFEDVLVDDPLRGIGAGIPAVPGVTVEAAPAATTTELPCEYPDYRTLPSIISLLMLRVARLGKTRQRESNGVVLGILGSVVPPGLRLG
jgi:hypothetical protein